jgi:hypothetical protein
MTSDDRVPREILTLLEEFWAAELRIARSVVAHGPSASDLDRAAQTNFCLRVADLAEAHAKAHPVPMPVARRAAAITVRNTAVGSEEFAIAARKRHGGGDPKRLIGPRHRAPSVEEIHARVRTVWPDSVRSGSVGPWLWWGDRERRDGDFVAEAWPVHGSPGDWWYRILSKPEGTHARP